MKEKLENIILNKNEIKSFLIYSIIIHISIMIYYEIVKNKLKQNQAKNDKN